MMRYEQADWAVALDLGRALFDAPISEGLTGLNIFVEQKAA